MKRLVFSVSFLLSLCMTVNLAMPATITGKVKTKRPRDAMNAVLFIEKAGDNPFPPPKEHAIMDQKNLTFVPHALPILKGTTVVFPNSDEVRHNVYSKSEPKQFNLGTYPAGETRSINFDKAGEVELHCNVHAEMGAYILILENPYFAVPNRRGEFTIPNVPPGQYKIKAWHENLKQQTKDITVTDGETITVDFELTR